MLVINSPKHWQIFRTVLMRWKKVLSDQRLAKQRNTGSCTLVPQSQGNRLSKIKIPLTKNKLWTIARKINYNIHKLQHKLLKVLVSPICSWFLGARKFAVQLFSLKGPFTQFFRKANTCYSFMKTFSIPLYKLMLKLQLHRELKSSLFTIR